MSELKNGHAIVTGGYKGIGAAISRMLAAKGCRVSVLARDGRAAEEFAATLPDAQGFSCDVTDAKDVARAFTAARSAFGSIRILVANAGGTVARSFSEETLDGFEQSIAVNLTGVFLTAKSSLPDMTEEGFGRIVVVASTAGLKAYPGVSSYVAAKHGAVGLVKALALETAKSGVTVNAVCPGYTETDLARQGIEALMEKGLDETAAREKLARTNPMRRLIDPEEVANAVDWLVSPGSDAITGQAIAVAGGEVMG